MWDKDGGKSRDADKLLSLGIAPARAPQNLRAIRTDSGLIVEWEEVIPEDPGEGPLGPYKLSWVQENGTQVRETALSACLFCSAGGPGPPTAPGNTLHPLWQGQLPVPLVCIWGWDSPVATLYAKQEAYSCHYKRGWGSGAQIKLCLQPRLYFLSSRDEASSLHLGKNVAMLRRLCATAPLITHCTPKVPRFLAELFFLPSNPSWRLPQTQCGGGAFPGCRMS